ncbi:MAG: hypothetical protein RLZZ546_2501 [Bacteroidota bacterium]|jgi:hypothetical protein
MNQKLEIIDETQMKISDLAKGIYLVKVKTDNTYKLKN